ncbi:hypothetical protein GGR57DRAFT_360959 [Xylariaceae sp. FL1272]|nr:hypothetical protein GGR57DRAFT_360959 [Xylariaceae sp. FL1272]
MTMVQMARLKAVYHMLWAVLPAAGFDTTFDSFGVPTIEKPNDITSGQFDGLDLDQLENSQERPVERSIQTPASRNSHTLIPNAVASTTVIDLRVRNPQVTPPTGPDGGPSASVSSSVSSSVSTSVSNVVSNSVVSREASKLTSSLGALSSSSSAAVSLASNSAFSIGSTQASNSAELLIASANSRADKASSSVSSLLAVVTTASIISSIQASANSAISAAQESAESAISAAKASASAAVDNSHSNLRLDVGQFVGIVIAIIIASILLAVLATLLIVRYRKQKIPIALKTYESPAPSVEQVAQPKLTQFPNHPVPPTYAVTVTAGRHQSSQTRSQPPNLSSRIQAFPSPTSPQPVNTQTYPMSPPSETPHEGPRRAVSEDLGRRLHGNIGHMSGTDVSEVPPMKFSLVRKPSTDGQQRMQVVRVGSHETGLHRLLSNAHESGARGHSSGQALGYSSKVGPSSHYTDLQSAHRRSTSSSAIIPPIPLRFSSLNVKRQHPLNPVQALSAAHETSFLSTSEETLSEDHQHRTDESLNQPPSPPRHLPVRNLTQPQHPPSRFSMSPLPPSFSDSGSDTSIQEQHQQDISQHNREAPEISPLRPAPPNPPQLQSPVPQRPIISANAGSMEARMPRTPRQATFSLFPRTPPE